MKMGHKCLLGFYGRMASLCDECKDISFSIITMESPYSLVWNDPWTNVMFNYI
jgi:hypothetical protein